MSWGMTIILITGLGAFVLLPYLTDFLVPGFEAEAKANYIVVSRLLLLSPILFTLSNTYGRILMSFKEFLWYGFSPVLYNVGILFGALLLAPRFGIYGLVTGTLLGNGLHLLIRWVILKRQRFGLTHKIDFTFSPEIK